MWSVPAGCLFQPLSTLVGCYRRGDQAIDLMRHSGPSASQPALYTKKPALVSRGLAFCYNIGAAGFEPATSCSRRWRWTGPLALSRSIIDVYNTCQQQPRQRNWRFWRPLWPQWPQTSNEARSSKRTQCPHTGRHKGSAFAKLASDAAPIKYAFRLRPAPGPPSVPLLAHDERGWPPSIAIKTPGAWQRERE
jgi:hypothetical protein